MSDVLPTQTGSTPLWVQTYLKKTSEILSTLDFKPNPFVYHLLAESKVQKIICLEYQPFLVYLDHDEFL